MAELARVEAADAGGARVVRVTGEVDLSNVHAVSTAIADGVPADATRVVLDLSETGYLDSAGVAMLFRLVERLRVRRQELRLVVPDDAPIRGVLRLTTLDKRVPVDGVLARNENVF